MIAVVGLACGCGLVAQERALPPDVLGGIRLYEAWVEEQMAYRGIAGLAVAVIHDQEVVWSRGFGYADVDAKAPVTAKSVFRMASHTKMFTAAAVMQLRDAGKLRLDDPVSKHLPWFQIKPAAEDDPPITIEQLLTHGSGLPREAAGPYWVTFDFPSKEAVAKNLAEQAAAFSPFERWKYSNLGYSLAGYLVEAVSGEAYDVYLRKHILDPLGMASTTLDREVAGLASGYGRRMPDGSRKRMPFSDTKGVAAAAGLSSNLEDMAKFVSLQFRKGPAGGSQILRASTLREMHRARFLQPAWTSGWGLGFSVNRRDGKLYVGHGGSLAGYKTQTSFVPSEKIGVVVLANADDARPEQFAERALQMIGAAVVKAAAPAAAPAAPWDVSWSRFAGLYRSIWGDSQIVEGNRALVLMNPLSENPAGENLERLVPLGNGRFKLEGAAGGSSVGETVSFETDSSGRVVRMRMGNMVLDRVSGADAK